MKRVALLLIAFATISGYLSTHQQPIAYAQTAENNGGQALEITPPVINRKLNPGESINVKLRIRNVSGGPLIVNGSVNDFVANEDETGAPKILIPEYLTEEELARENPYSVQNWISPMPQLLLESQESEDLPITISVPANASPGGYFGVVRFTGVPPELEGTGVSLSASLGSLLLISVNGEAEEQLEIEEFFISKDGKKGELFQSTPIEFTQRLKNTGNIHLEPAGQVTITDMFGKKIAAVNINLPPGNVLPQSIRKFSQPLDERVIGNKALFGRYTADLSVNYGENRDKTVTSSLTFWVIPYTLIGIFIAIVVVGFIALRIGIKRYNRHIIKQAQKNKRK